MRQMWIFIAALVLGLAGSGTVAVAQPTDTTAADSSSGGPAWYEDAWTDITTHEGVRFSYIFYSKADTQNNGVVVRLQNTNSFPVRYAFTVIFRTPTAERSVRTSGHLEAGEMKTGEGDGLFWIPFTEEGQTIGEIGLRGIRIERAAS